jgi:hypothetical protein
MNTLLAGGDLDGGQNGGQAAGGRDHSFVAHQPKMAQQAPVGRYLGLAAEALGDVGGGPAVDTGFPGRDLGNGLSHAATFAGAQANDVS